MSDEKPDFEEATRCPKCGQVGYQASSRNVKSQATGRRVTVYVYKCDNNLCLWYNTGWLVQPSGDGVVARGNQRGDNAFKALTPYEESRARAILHDADQNYEG